jgi:predicted membrane protein
MPAQDSPSKYPLLLHTTCLLISFFPPFFQINFLAARLRKILYSKKTRSYFCLSARENILIAQVLQKPFHFIRIKVIVSRENMQIKKPFPKIGKDLALSI